MTRIAISGAGGMVFPLTLAADLLATPALHGATLVLHDLSLERAERTARAVRRVAEHHAIPISLEVTDNLERALEGTLAVFLTFQVGGLEAYRTDIEIPRRYGIDCVAGDTLNPGGVFRFLRSVPAFERLAQAARAVNPNVLVLNYANPMAMNCLYLHALGLRAVGLCHSIPGTASLLERWLEVPEGQLAYRATGINHQAWFLELRHEGRDLRPDLTEALERFLPEFGGVTPFTSGGPAYVGGQERVRAELMRTFGYFLSESSHHVSEYVPYFRRRPEQAREVLPRRWDYLRGSLEVAGQEQRLTAEAVTRLEARLERSPEYGMRILEALVSGKLLGFYGNVPNVAGLIPNLPREACVEVPCVADSNGVRPVPQPKLPAACAGLNLTGVAPQVAAVEAALERDPDGITSALALDPLTASLLDLADVRRMALELRRAQTRWLPAWARV